MGFLVEALTKLLRLTTWYQHFLLLSTCQSFFPICCCSKSILFVLPSTDFCGCEPKSLHQPQVFTRQATIFMGFKPFKPDVSAISAISAISVASISTFCWLTPLNFNVSSFLVVNSTKSTIFADQFMLIPAFFNGSITIFDGSLLIFEYYSHQNQNVPSGPDGVIPICVFPSMEHPQIAALVSSGKSHLYMVVS